jgi:hypothetical protein
MLGARYFYAACALLFLHTTHIFLSFDKLKKRQILRFATTHTTNSLTAFSAYRFKIKINETNYC